MHAARSPPGDGADVAVASQTYGDGLANIFGAEWEVPDRADRHVQPELHDIRGNELECTSVLFLGPGLRGCVRILGLWLWIAFNGIRRDGRAAAEGAYVVEEERTEGRHGCRVGGAMHMGLSCNYVENDGLWR